ncbi:MAG: Flagellar biosynthesis protein FlhA [Frankiales bacterium]|nr:Flagellar biosynthesis protein FlhA [Frankiales bacterium]
MAETYDAWSAWLRDRFDEHRQIRRPADLVRAGGNKPNGRPVIDASTITQWLRGRRPSYQLAVAAADAFGRPHQEALQAAGYVLPTQEQMVEANRAAERRNADANVGPEPEAPDEMVFRLRVPPNATPRQRETARRAAEASARAVLEELDREGE